MSLLYKLKKLRNSELGGVSAGVWCIAVAALLLLALVQPGTASPSRKKTTASAHIWRDSLLFLAFKAYLYTSYININRIDIYYTRASCDIG